MKKAPLLILLIAMICINGFGQTGFGIKTGYNLSTLKFDSDSLGYFTPRNHFNIGLFLNFPVKENMSVQTDVLFSGSGATSYADFESAMDTSSMNVYFDYRERKHVLNYISIPVVFKYSVSWFNVHAGPQVGILGRALVDDKYTREALVYDSTSILPHRAVVASSHKLKDVQQMYKMFDFGFTGGIGGEWGRFILQARYYLGLSNITKREGHMSNRVFQVSVGWNLSQDY